MITTLLNTKRAIIKKIRKDLNYNKLDCKVFLEYLSSYSHSGVSFSPTHDFIRALKDTDHYNTIRLLDDNTKLEKVNSKLLNKVDKPVTFRVKGLGILPIGIGDTIHVKSHKGKVVKTFPHHYCFSEEEINKYFRVYFPNAEKCGSDILNFFRVGTHDLVVILDEEDSNYYVISNKFPQQFLFNI